MAQVELVMPKMGESIIEATIIKWVKKVGDRVEAEETILEIATDKVDSIIPSPVSGTIVKILFEEDETVKIGKTIAVIAREGEDILPTPSHSEPDQTNSEPETVAQKEVQPQANSNQNIAIEKETRPSTSERFYSPLVRNIAQKENISIEALAGIEGTGLNSRVTKKDILDYLKNRKNEVYIPVEPAKFAPLAKESTPISTPLTVEQTKTPSISGNVEIIEMDRMRKLIANHMVLSKRISPHVTSFVEVDVTEMVNWRNKIKAEFQSKHGENITFMPLFIEAVAKAIKDFPLVNVSVDGDRIIVKKDINIGMATALPSGNLIVPVLKNADYLNVVGLTKKVNSLAERSRKNQLKPEDVQEGTFTLTNVGTFGNTMGVPIINQPQVAILAVGAIKKKPAVLETEFGDVIAIRQLLFLSLSYDHRVVDGMLGGSFLRRIADYLEGFDAQQSI